MEMRAGLPLGSVNDRPRPRDVVMSLVRTNTRSLQLMDWYRRSKVLWNPRNGDCKHRNKKSDGRD
jgi:hypothetical protein